MVKVGGKLATWPCVDIKIAGGSEKRSRDTLFLAKSDDKGITTGFYDKKRGYGKRMELYPNFSIYWSHNKTLIMVSIMDCQSRT